jgi:N-acetyl sugar amidotransferase
VKYCKICLQPNTRPGILFNSDSICPSCIYSQSLYSVDWSERRKELDLICEFGRANNHSGYDCIIGVSGGKDSTRQAFFVKDVLKMNPLLVCLGYPPEQITQRGVDNVSNLISHGFDCISINPSPQVWNKLMRKGFLEFCNWGKSTELALFSSVPRLAIAYQIPLIWWGENAALQLGDLNVMGKNGSDGNNLRKMNTLGNGDYTWILSEEIKQNQILQYCYPSIEEMDNANLRITFLGYFWKDWSKLDNGNFSTLRGLEIRTDKPEKMGDILGVEALDENWVVVNQMIKYLKFGFGKVTDYVNEEIRAERMTRNEAIFLVEKYDGTCGEEYIQSFCNYIDISYEQFWDHVDKNVNKDLFFKVGTGKYERKFKTGFGL